MKRRRRRRPGGVSDVLAPVSVLVVAAGLPLGLALSGGAAGLVERQQFAVGLWAILFVGFLFGVLPRARLARSTWLVAAAALALLVWMVAGLAWTESVERTFAEIARLVMYLGLGTLALTTLHARNWRWAASGILIGSALICVIALASRLAPDVGVWGSRALIGQERLNYPFEYWNSLAFVAAATIVLGVGFACFARDRAARVLALAVTPVAALVLYLTYSRGGVVAALVGLLALLALAGVTRRVLGVTAALGLAAGALILVVRSQPQIANDVGSEGSAVVAFATLIAMAACGYCAGRLRIRRTAAPSHPWRMSARPRTAVAGLCMLAAVVVAAFAFALASRDSVTGAEGGAPVVGTADPASRLTSLESPRWELWASAATGFAAAPVGGHGAGTFSYWWDGEGRSDDLVVDSHSLYLDALEELGFVGLAILVAALVGLLLVGLGACKRASRRSDRGLLAALIAVYLAFLAQAGVDWLWEVTAVGALGLGAALVALARTSVPQAPGPFRLGRVLALAGCTLAIVVQAPGLAAEDRIERSVAASRAGQDQLAIELAGEAVAAAPWFAGPRVQRARAELAAGESADARTDALAAAEREPLEWRHQVLLARTALASNDLELTDAYLARAGALRPVAAPLFAAIRRAIDSGDRTALDRYGPTE